MNREESFRRMIEASALFQYNIALMLEAKAHEAEKSRNWICHHLYAEALNGHVDQLEQTNEIHEQIIELIDGLTKMENSLASNLRVVLNREQEEESGSGGGLGFGGSLFDFDGDAG